MAIKTLTSFFWGPTPVPVSKARNKVGRKLIALIIAFSSLITLVITAFQLLADYHDQRANLDNLFNQVTVSVPSLSESVWAFDENQISLALNALINLRHIEYASVETTNGKKRKWDAGQQISKQAVDRLYPLVQVRRGKALEIGTLKVVGSLDAIYNSLLSKAFGILVSNGIKTFFVAIFMFFLFHKYVTRRIEVLADTVRQLETDLQLNDSGHQAAKKDMAQMDEIDAVNHVFDEMSQKLYATIEALHDTNRQLQNANLEISTANDELEQRVEERTEHLQEEIRQRQIADQSLRENEQRFRDIAESASDWFWETDSQHCFTYLSNRCFEVTGMSAQDLLGKSRFALVERNILEQNVEKWERFQQTLRDRKPIKGFQYVLYPKHGKPLTIQLNGYPYWNEDGEFSGYRGAARDITERVQHEMDLQQSKVDADTANRAKSEFISSMSHELRTPLNGILGFSQLLELHPEMKLAPAQLDYVAQIRIAGEHLLNLINDILDLSKIESGKFELSLAPIDPVSIVQSNLETLQPLALKHQVELIFDSVGFDENFKVWADPTRFSQIMMNLCSNAIKYNREDGRVDVLIQNTPQHKLRVSVSDTGIGISPENFDKLFMPFNRLDAEGSGIEGTGVGLSVTLKLIELMDGKISFDSREGEGTTFVFELPLTTSGTNPGPLKH
ncbi:MAG: ATP-binding protein [Magnetovibrio sp.]|nr:ATP-binding protein [Magnetovibrio sp.]